MSSDEEKPPAPPLRLTSNRGSEAVSLPVDMRPLPKEPDLESREEMVEGATICDLEPRIDNIIAMLLFVVVWIIYNHFAS